MDLTKKIHLNSDEVISISSDYIRNGRQFESWKLDEIIVEEKTAIMTASMLSIYPSITDTNKFHLSIFIAEEMVSQLIIIYLHIWSGKTKKTQEVWLKESSTKSIRSIRAMNNIKVEMNIETIRKRAETIFCIANYKITDENNGLLELKQKVILS